MALSPFPGENFLTHHLPDYETEWKTISLKAIIATIVFIVLVPKVVQLWFCSGFTAPSRESSTTNKTRSSKNEDESFSRPNESRPNHKIRVVTKTTINAIEGRRIISRKDNNNNIVSSRNRSIQKVRNEAPNHGHATNDDENNAKKVPNFIFPFINAVYLAYLFFLILQSPNNKDTARMVYMAPLLKQHETDMIIKMATNAAERNARKAKEELDRLSKDDKSSSNEVKRLEKLLEWPAGFLKDRHSTYPTTDLNVVIDFEDEDKSTIGQILDARLGPLLERIYGVSKDSLRTNDMFVVRYDGEGQQSLGMHTDSSHISFNVLLNDDFEGGGTRFHNLKDDSHQDANPKPGNVLINNAMVLHEGLPTTKGTRYIMVGFMNVDVKDPWSGVKKHVSWFSTYLSIPWLTVVLKEALEIKSQSQQAAASRLNRDGTNHHQQGSKDRLILSLITEAFWSVYAMGNSLAHDIVSLVREEDADAYIDALDSSYNNGHDNESHRGVRWFSGQQIHLNWNGLILSEWQARMDNQGKFHGTH